MLLRPIGLAIAAPLAAWLGIRQALELFSGISALVIAALLAFPAVWRMQLEPALTENS